MISVKNPPACKSVVTHRSICDLDSGPCCNSVVRLCLICIVFCSHMAIKYTRMFVKPFTNPALFSFVERFRMQTDLLNPQRCIRYWAGVTMWNTRRQDKSREGIRQYANRGVYSYTELRCASGKPVKSQERRSSKAH